MKTLFTTTSARKCYIPDVLGIVLFLFSASFVFGESLNGKPPVLTSSSSSSGFQYTVGVDSIYRTKEILATVTNQLNATHRYITPTGFTFFSKNEYTQAFIESLFLSAGVPSISFSKEYRKLSPENMEKVGGTDCEQAQILCANTSLSGNSSGFGTQELNGTNSGCLVGYEHQSSWYYLNVQTGGSLGFTIDPSSNSDDYDFAVWGPFTAATAGANCPPVSAPIRCSFSAQSDLTGLISSYYGQTSSFGCGFLGLFACYGTINVTDNSENSGGDSWVAPLSVSANQIYILLVDNFSTSSNPYSMSFNGTAVLGCTPVVLPVELSQFDGFSSGSQNILKWTTQSEKDNDYFLIETLEDQATNSWSSVGVVYSGGDSWEKQEYSLVHKNPSLSRINYYRITQFDNNGYSKTFDKMVAIDNKISQKPILKIVNLLGQEVDASTKGMVIYIFEDGTSTKVFK